MAPGQVILNEPLTEMSAVTISFARSDDTGFRRYDTFIAQPAHGPDHLSWPVDLWAPKIRVQQEPGRGAERVSRRREYGGSAMR